MLLERRRRRKPRQYGSIREGLLSSLELAEYRQNGCIRIKDTPLSRGEKTSEFCKYRAIDFRPILDYNFDADESNRSCPPRYSYYVDTEEFGSVRVEDLDSHYALWVYKEKYKPMVIQLIRSYGYRATTNREGDVLVWKERLECDWW